MTADNLERVLFARLSIPTASLSGTAFAADPESAPLKWLLRSYSRAYAETRKTLSRDKDYADKLAGTLAAGEGRGRLDNTNTLVTSLVATTFSHQLSMYKPRGCTIPEQGTVLALRKWGTDHGD